MYRKYNEQIYGYTTYAAVGWQWVSSGAHNDVDKRKRVHVGASLCAPGELYASSKSAFPKATSQREEVSQSDQSHHCSSQ